MVDFETDPADRASARHRAAERRVRGGACALALERATGLKVGSVAFVVAALGGEAHVFEDVTDLVAEARAALRAPFS
jgi:hypothetical protein